MSKVSEGVGMYTFDYTYDGDGEMSVEILSYRCEGNYYFDEQESDHGRVTVYSTCDEDEISFRLVASEGERYKSMVSETLSLVLKIHLLEIQCLNNHTFINVMFYNRWCKKIKE